jgi:hypothetical protein
MEFLMSIKTKIIALALAALAVTGSLASTTTQAQAGGGGGGGAPGWVGPAILGAAIVGTAVAASNGPYYDGYRRCGWVRTTCTAITWAKFAAVTSDDRLSGLWIYASGTGASSTPCRTRPARSSPRAGQPFPGDFVIPGGQPG